MKRYWKKKWLAALRSGEYKQGRGVLRRRRRGVDRYCCLGVLADLAAPKKWGESHGKSEAFGHGGSSVGRLRAPFRERLGMSHKHQETLINMNDSGKRFPTIAKWIEENL